MFVGVLLVAFGAVYGAVVVERVAKHVSARLKNLLREGNLLARFGGDEFVVLLKGVSRREVAGVAARYRAALEAPFVIDGRELRGVGSLGTVSYPEQGHKVDELLRSADAAMCWENAARHSVEGQLVVARGEEQLLARPA